VGLDGKPRQVHVEQSLRSIRWNDFEPAPVRAAPTSGVIADCDEFRIRRVVLGRSERLELAANEQPRILSVVNGGVMVGNTKVQRGDNVLLPYAGTFTLVAPDAAVLLLTENFVGNT
jgi:mannose-6-phosphate isomerase